MDDRDKKILTKNRVKIVKELIPTEVVQYLIENDILSDIMAEKVNSKHTSYDRNVELLVTLPKRGPRAFQVFVDTLNASDHQHLAQLLQPSHSTETLLVSNDNNTPRGPPDTTDFLNQETNRSLNSSYNQTNNMQPEASHFHFSSFGDQTPYSSASMIGQSLQSPVRRRPTENIECSSFAPLRSGGCPIDAKRRYVERPSTSVEMMDTVPSPCDDLDDIISNTSDKELLSAASLSLPKCAAQRTKTSTAKNIFTSRYAADKFVTSTPIHIASSSTAQKNFDPFMQSIDLADGPTHEDLIVRRSTNQEQRTTDCYDMISRLRGLALIISVERFEPSAGLDDRLAGDVDRARLEFVLRQLGFKCYLLVDGTADKISTVLKKFAALEDHFHTDCTFVIVMSHGEEGCFFGRDGGRVEISKVQQLFSNENCRGLQNKPKVLLFQACRGSNPDKGVDEMDGGHGQPDNAVTDRFGTPEGDTLSRSSSQSSGSTQYGNSRTVRNKLPSHSDCLVGYATVKGYAAMRNTWHGSWYIQALVRVLAYHSCDKHLIDMMTIVNNLVKGREGWSPASQYHRCKEMSEFHSTLCKKMFLLPGLFDQ